VKTRSTLIYVGLAGYAIIAAAAAVQYYVDKSRFFADCPWGSKPACEAQWAAMHPDYSDVNVWAPMRSHPTQESADR
jgi:hypothetical protein